jgi:hypothetical protein
MFALGLSRRNAQRPDNAQRQDFLQDVHSISSLGRCRWDDDVFPKEAPHMPFGAVLRFHEHRLGAERAAAGSHLQSTLALNDAAIDGFTDYHRIY